MDESKTQKLLSDIVARIGRMEATIEERLHDTRPMFESLKSEIVSLREGQDQLREGQDRLRKDVEALKVAVHRLEERQDRVEVNLKDIDRTLRRFQLDILRQQEDFDERILNLESRMPPAPPK